MKGLDWAYLYDTYHAQALDIAAIEIEISRLIRDSDIQKPLGIIPYVLTRDEHSLDLRSFPDDVKFAVWEKQHHICPHCQKECSYEQMECNRRKGNK